MLASADMSWAKWAGQEDLSWAPGRPGRPGQPVVIVNLLGLGARAQMPGPVVIN